MATIKSLRQDIIADLQNDILRMQGCNPPALDVITPELGPLLQAFPNQSFPGGAVHEFISASPEDLAATCGFVAGLIASLSIKGGTTIWISQAGTPFPPALKTFGISPDRVIFVNLAHEKDALWTMEETLKCSSITSVVAEMNDLSFIASRRLQLAVEQSKVTGFVLRKQLRKVGTTACVARWKITPLPGETGGLPGVGQPVWRVELLRVRNGKPGTWEIRWENRKFHPLLQPRKISETQIRKAV